jgi:hypothetical protein
MSDTFVPLISMTGSVTGGGSMPVKVLSPAESKSAFAPLATAANTGARNTPPTVCGKPKLTLQRQGDVVSLIRIECGCGQVIELKCGY